MFSSDDILVLSKAGFTAQQIAGLSMMRNNTQNTTTAPAQNTTPPPTQNTTTAPAQNTTTAPAQNTTPAPAQSTTPAPTQNTTPAADPILAELQKLTGLIQAGNIQSSTIPETKTPEQILADIINPPIRKE